MNTKNSSKKSTYPFFETLCVLNGKIKHLEYHEKRYSSTYKHHFGKLPNQPLIDLLEIPFLHKKGRVKLKVSYNDKEKKVAFSTYPYVSIKSLQCIEAPALNYDHKYTDRRDLNNLFLEKGSCDDVLILQHGWVRDSSYTNICFWDGKQWITPKKPLLHGTARQRLLDEKKIVMDDIHIRDFQKFKGFKLINAMRDFEQDSIRDINNIFLPS